MKENNINPKNVIIHAPYIVNLANEKNFEFSINFLKQEIKRVNSWKEIEQLLLKEGVTTK